MRLVKAREKNFFYKDKTSIWVGCINNGYSICYISFDGFYTRTHTIYDRNQYHL